ncbi:MAG: DUF1080 domain-containing protein [Planctomycetaceae bacterium]|jgi:hypothetical protein|nr:DUF1080 domain-containing protein [Planctomycetaceae bacterium]
MKKYRVCIFTPVSFGAAVLMFATAVLMFVAAVLIFATVAVAENAGSGEFVQLVPAKSISWSVNSKPIAGLVKRGGNAVFTAERNEIAAQSGKGGKEGDTFLCTEKEYSNFILQFDVKYDIECNSGVQFRSSITDINKIEQLNGYRCEIVPKNDTANIFDMNRRNRFLTEPTAELQAKINRTFKRDNWNEITIQCVGPSIKTWLNGEKISDLFDLESNEGIIGFKIPSGESGQVRWRNIRVKELPVTPWLPLYAEKKLGAVETKPVGKWEILEDGSLKGTTEKGQPKDGMILSKESYKNFAVKVSFKIISGNSGLYFRAAEVDKPHWMKGFQCEIATGSADGDNAGLWEVEGRGWVARNVKLAKKIFKQNEWNCVGTTAIGDRLVTFLNGWKVVDIVDSKCAKEGKTGLQLHGGGDQGCLFKEYYIMPLDKNAVELIEK